MQTTLLGIAIAFILALLAALVGPYFVDWNDYRARFEAEAGKLVGLQVRVTGPIDMRLLPTPSVKLAGIELGPQGEASRLRARALGIQLQLGPLLRGEIRAAEIRLAGLEFSLGINSLGRVDWPAMTLAAGDSVAVERLTVEDGRAILSDAQSGSQLVLEKLRFEGDLRSLLGPVRGEGGFSVDGVSYGYRLSLGRWSDEGLRVRLAVDTEERPFSVETEGLLAFERGAPRYEGGVTASRPAGVVLANGRTQVAEPVKIVSKVSLRADAALFDQLEIHYGPEERVLNLTGAAQLRLGERPRLQGALSARQIDLDRLIATAAAPRRPPLSAVQALGEMFGSALRPPVPVSLAVGIDALTLGGATLQGFGSDIRAEGGGWHLDRLEFRAPGFTQVKLSGRLDAEAGLGFSGAASIDASDPRALVAWLTGTPAAAAQIRPWQMRGEVVLNPEGISIANLKTDLERGSIEGRLAYAWPAGQRPARLDADLKAGEIDIDAILGFADSALSGSGLEAPREVSLAFEVERARLAGFDARRAAARVRLDPDGIAIERLSVADFGNASIEANGRIETGARPGGTLTIDLDARDMAGVIALAERFAPDLAGPVRSLAGPRNAAKLRSTVSLERGGAGQATGKLALAGRIGAVGVDLNGAATGRPEAFSVTDLAALKGAELRLDGRLEADDGGALLAVLGLERLAGSVGRPARLVFNAAGPMNGALRVEGRLAGGLIDAEAKGTARLAGDQPAALDFERIAGRLAGRKAEARLALVFADPVRVDGTVELDEIDVPATVAATIGMRTTGGKGWSQEPFARGHSDVSGRIAFRAPRAALTPALPVRGLRGVARLGTGQLVFEDVEGETAGGRLSGRLALAASPDGVSARARLALSGADAASVIPHGGGLLAPATGRISIEAEVEGAGLSPAAFAGSLSGKGTVTLAGARLASLNPRAFDALLRAVDLGIATDTARVRDFMASALDSGTLPVERATADLAIAGGQVRLANVSLRASGADIGVSGLYSLSEGTIDATLSMTGTAATAGSMRPVVFVALRGPATAPVRTVDAAALTGWLALRQVEQQSKRLEEMEKAREAARLRDEERRREEARLEEQRRQAREREEALERERRAKAAPVEDAVPPPRDGKPQPSGDNADTATPAAPAAVPPTAERAPPLPPATTIPAMPRPKPEGQPAPRADTTAMPPPRPAASGPPLNLLGAHN